MQEPSQHVIEQAAMNSLQNGTGFFFGGGDNILQQIGNSELVQSAKQWPEIFTQLAPTVASSTALTQALIGLGGMGYNHRYNRKMRAKVPEAISNLEAQRAKLQSNIDNIPTAPYDTNVANTRAQIIAEAQANAKEQANANAQTWQGKTPQGQPQNRLKVQKAQSKARKWRLEHAQAQAREQTQSELQGIDRDLQTLRDYAESKPSWWEADAPQELYSALGKGEAMSIFADDEDLKEDSTPEPSPEQTTQSAEEPTTQRLVDDEPDIDLDETKTQPDTSTTQDTTAEQNDTHLLPPSAQLTDNISSPFDNISASDNNQNLVDDAEGESYHQTTQGTQANINAGEFTFSTKGKSYTFGVASTHSNDTGSSGIANDRRMRYQGRRLEIRNSKGQVIATYHPYTGSFTFTPDMEKKHGSRWLNSFKNQFMSNVNDYLGRGGFLDANGNLASDGNEAFRRAWDKRRKSDANSFYDDIAYPEDAVSYEQPQTSKSASVGQEQVQKSTSTGQAQTRKSSIIDRIRSVVNGDIYHQSEAAETQKILGTFP